MGELDPQLDKFLRKQPKLGKNVFIAKTADRLLLNGMRYAMDLISNPPPLA
ncbi:MAG TPA: hypothetical protein VGI63_04960 [Verrucomicrobiae bacterium]|jgi:hypothetical protein